MNHTTLQLPKSGISEIDYGGKCVVQFLARPASGRPQRCRITTRTPAEAAFIVYHLAAIWQEEEGKATGLRWKD